MTQVPHEPPVKNKCTQLTITTPRPCNIMDFEKLDLYKTNYVRIRKVLAFDNEENIHEHLSSVPFQDDVFHNAFWNLSYLDEQILDCDIQTSTLDSIKWDYYDMLITNADTRSYLWNSFVGYLCISYFCMQKVIERIEYSYKYIKFQHKFALKSLNEYESKYIDLTEMPRRLSYLGIQKKCLLKNKCEYYANKEVSLRQLKKAYLQKQRQYYRLYHRAFNECTTFDYFFPSQLSQIPIVKCLVETGTK